MESTPPAHQNFPSANVAPAPAALPAQPERAPALHLWIVLTYFIVAFSSQLILLIPEMSPFRVVLRTLPFMVSLLLAIFPAGRHIGGFRKHPALGAAGLVLCILAIGLFNQYTQSVTAGLAQIALVTAILSPLLWVGRLQLGSRGLAIVIFCLWGFNAVSAGFGVLQVRFPGHFQPATSIIVQEFQERGITANIELADGTEMERPYGLTDNPGGAAAAGMIAFIFGLGLLVYTRNWLFKAIFLTGMGVGLFVIYLSQVRVSIVMCGVATVAFCGIMSMRGEFGRLTGALLALAVVVIVSTSAAFVIGGNSTRDRFLTLVDDDAGSVYHNNRGVFLDYTFEYVLPSYPIGAGLGRYGMVAHYFNNNGPSDALWAEIQWTAWAYDGGWLMILAYPIAIFIALWNTFKIGKDRTYGPVGVWAAILTCYNISVFAVLFSYPFFVSQGGLEFWLLNAACFSAAQVYRESLKPNVPEGFAVIPAPWRPKVAPADDGRTAPSDLGAGPAPRRRPLARCPLPAVVPVFDAADRGPV
jgi:hypothetical protein